MPISLNKEDVDIILYIKEGAGSGVIVKSNGYIVTNNHVIEGDYLETIGIEKLIELRVDPGYGWKRGLKRK